VKGELVVLRNRWIPNPPVLGIIIEELPDDKCLVLWCTKNGIKIKEHLCSAVLPVKLMSDIDLKKRKCTSM